MKTIMRLTNFIYNCCEQKPKEEPKAKQQPRARKIFYQNCKEYLNSLEDDETSIDLQGMNLTVLPDLKRFTKLKSLYLSHNNLITLDVPMDADGNYLLPKTLEYLYANNNQLTTLAVPMNSLKHLTNLKVLEVSGNKLTTLAVPIVLPDSIQRLNISFNQLEELPNHLPITLTDLDFKCNKIKQIPNTKHLTNLQTLDCSWNPLTTIFPIENNKVIFPPNLKTLYCSRGEYYCYDHIRIIRDDYKEYEIPTSLIIHYTYNLDEDDFHFENPCPSCYDAEKHNVIANEIANNKIKECLKTYDKILAVL